MDSKPVIFISAVSKELHSARDLVAKTLHFLGYEAIWQDVFGMEQGDLKAVLRRKIDASSGVIQLLGRRYGAEPPQPDGQFGRVSYTQYEALYARQRGKKVWYLFLDEDFTTDPCEPESGELQQLQQAYRQRVQADIHLFHPIKDGSGMESCVLKLRDELGQLRRRGKQITALVLGLLFLLVLGGAWLVHGEKHIDQTLSDTQKTVTETKQQVSGIVERYAKMEQALIKLAEVETHATQPSEKLTQDELRQRAYTILENELGIAAGTLSKELPAFALELYNRDDTKLLMKARAAYALNKFEEAEKLFLENDAQQKKKEENAQAVADNLRKERIESLEGAGQSAQSQIHYARALDHYRASAALTNREADPTKWAEIQINIGAVLRSNGQLKEAETTYRDIINYGQKTLGFGKEPLQMAHNNLGAILRAQGKAADAEVEIRAALTMMKAMPKPNERDILLTRMNLANALGDEGKKKEEADEYEAIWSIAKDAWEPEDRALLMLRGNLAIMRRSEGDLKAVEQEQREILEIETRVLGTKDPQTLSTRNHLAITLLGEEDTKAAEIEFRAVLDARKNTLGERHLDTQATRACLGQTLRLQDKLPEAEEEFRKAAETFVQLQGEDSPASIDVLYSLAETLTAEDKHQDVEPLIRSILMVRKRKFGPDNPETLRAHDNLAECLFMQRKYAEAEMEQRVVLKGRVRVQGAEHPDTLVCWQNLTEILDCQGKHAEAEVEHRAVLDIQNRVLGAEHPAVFQRCYNLALCLEAQKKLKEALEFMQRAEAGLKKVLGPEHLHSKAAQQVRERIEAALKAKP